MQAFGGMPSTRKNLRDVVQEALAPPAASRATKRLPQPLSAAAAAKRSKQPPASAKPASSKAAGKRKAEPPASAAAAAGSSAPARRQRSEGTSRSAAAPRSPADDLSGDEFDEQAEEAGYAQPDPISADRRDDDADDNAAALLARIDASDLPSGPSELSSPEREGARMQALLRGDLSDRDYWSNYDDDDDDDDDGGDGGDGGEAGEDADGGGGGRRRRAKKRDPWVRLTKDELKRQLEPWAAGTVHIAIDVHTTGGAAPRIISLASAIISRGSSAASASSGASAPAPKGRRQKQQTGAGAAPAAEAPASDAAGIGATFHEYVRTSAPCASTVRIHGLTFAELQRAAAGDITSVLGRWLAWVNAEIGSATTAALVTWGALGSRGSGQLDVLMAELERMQKDLPSSPTWHLLDLELVAQQSKTYAAVPATQWPSRTSSGSKPKLSLVDAAAYARLTNPRLNTTAAADNQHAQMRMLGAVVSNLQQRGVVGKAVALPTKPLTDWAARLVKYESEREVDEPPSPWREVKAGEAPPATRKDGPGFNRGKGGPSDELRRAVGLKEVSAPSLLPASACSF